MHVFLLAILQCNAELIDILPASRPIEISGQLASKTLQLLIVFTSGKHSIQGAKCLA